MIAAMIIVGGFTALAMCASYLVVWAGVEIYDILNGE